MAISSQERRIERTQRRIDELRAWRNARECAIPDWTFTGSDGNPVELHLGDFWPVHELPVSLQATARVPAAWAGQPIELELWVGGEGFLRLSTGLQAGLNPMHHRFPLFNVAEGGEEVRIDVEAVPKGIFGTDIPEPRIERAHLVVPQREARALERDLTMILEATTQLGNDEVVPFILDVAENALLELASDWPSDTPTMVSRYVLGYGDGLGSGITAVPPLWRSEAADAGRPTSPTWSLPPAPRDLEPLPDEALVAIERARRAIDAGLAQIKADYPPVGRLALTGHAHIDLAWLWPLAETRRKIRRTFSTVLNLMDQYPDFTFNQSSAQAYAWIEHDDPALFERIKVRVAEGRWEPIGGMWLEPDCNVTGGESLVRHLIYGQRYFERAFGFRHRTAWLPDVFGFSGGIPQLLRGAGIDGFFTIKLNWNEENTFPHDLFIWEGIDGSRVTAHLFLNPGEGYNGNIAPLDTLGTWRNFKGKTKHPESLLAFGWGDGAGGPSEKMLENYARIKDFPRLPRLRMAKIEEFFAGLPDENLPRWTGELYLELHRGTLTSQARTKALNRAAEHRLLEAEAFGVIAAAHGFPVPSNEIEEAWKTLLLNQFHDILPGSSINEVYMDTHQLLSNVVDTATAVRDAALAHLGGGSDAVLVANPGLAGRPLQAVLPGQADAVAEGPLLSQPSGDDLLIASRAGEVPGLGWQVIAFDSHGEERRSDEQGVHAAAHDRGVTIENDLLRAEIGTDGTITRLYDKQHSRDALDGRGNQLWAYLDKPRAWDAWDVDESYESAGAEVSTVERLEITETGPVRAAVRVERRYRGSRIVQTYRLWVDSRRLEIATEIDWHERHVMLRARFPLAVRSHEATYETMFGAIRRPTHRNTSWDAARFEVAGHRFSDISEPGYGVSLLNDGKYGHAAHDNVLSMTLLRSPMYPDALADEGAHRFTYAVYPHAGDWTEAGVVREAFTLNSPLVIGPAARDCASSDGFVQVTGVELGLGALSIAKAGDGAILRVYEPHGRRGPVTLRFSAPIRRVERVNLLEDPVDGPPIEVHGDDTVRFDVRPFEVVTLRVVSGR